MGRHVHPRSVVSVSQHYKNLTKSSTKRISSSSSSHLKLTCFRHDIAEKLLIWRSATITNPLTNFLINVKYQFLKFEQIKQTRDRKYYPQRSTFLHCNVIIICRWLRYICALKFEWCTITDAIVRYSYNGGEQLSIIVWDSMMIPKGKFKNRISKEGPTIQRSIERGQEDKQRSTKHHIEN